MFHPYRNTGLQQHCPATHRLRHSSRDCRVDEKGVSRFILFRLCPLIRRRYRSHKFGGILYLQQRGQEQPMLAELLGNDVMKENLLQVVTILGPLPSGDSSTQGESYFQYTPIISQRNESAWKIINKVYQQVGCKDLTVGAVQPGLEITWKRSPESKKGGKSNGGAWSRMYRYFHRKNIS